MRGHRKIEDDKQSSRPEHAAHFGQSLVPGGHVPQPKGHGNGVENPVPKRQRQSVGLDEEGNILPVCLVKHGQAKIRTDHTRGGAGFLQGDSEVAAAGCEVQDACGCRGCDKACNP